MPFTANSDVFMQVTEEAISRILAHLVQQRPSLFNYATAFFIRCPELICSPPAGRTLPTRCNPDESELPLGAELTELPPFSILSISGSLGLNYYLLFTDLAVDLHPSNQFGFPEDFVGGLEAGQLALRSTVCVGLACPEEEGLSVVEEAAWALSFAHAYSVNESLTGTATPSVDEERILRDAISPESESTVPIQTNRGVPVPCFCLTLFATLTIARNIETQGERAAGPSRTILRPVLQGLEIVDVKPVELENDIECVLRLLLMLGLLPRLSLTLETATLRLFEDLPFLPVPPEVALSLPIRNQIPDNPLIGENPLRVFIDADLALPQAS